VWRNGRSTELHATIAEAAENQRVASTGGDQQPGDDRAEALGLHFASLTNDLRRELRLGRDAQGVVITRVDDGSTADSLGLRRGDVVVSINQETVNTPQDAARKLKQIADSPKKNALLLLNRHGVTQYVGVDLGKHQG